MNNGDLAGATIVFDLDGTLVDTAPDLLRVLNVVLDQEGLPHPPMEKVRFFIGQGARRLIERAAELEGVRFADDKLDAMLRVFVDLYAADIARDSAPFPGTVAALDALSEAGATLAVCTNKRTGLSVKLLDALGLTSRFAAIVGADSVPHKKPHPDHYRATVAQAGGDVARSVMIGGHINRRRRRACSGRADCPGQIWILRA